MENKKHQVELNLNLYKNLKKKFFLTLIYKTFINIITYYYKLFKRLH